MNHERLMAVRPTICGVLSATTNHAFILSSSQSSSIEIERIFLSGAADTIQLFFSCLARRRPWYWLDNLSIKMHASIEEGHIATHLTLWNTAMISPKREWLAVMTKSIVWIMYNSPGWFLLLLHWRLAGRWAMWDLSFIWHKDEVIDAKKLQLEKSYNQNRYLKVCEDEERES